MMVTLPSMLQAPLQSLLRPSMWIPGVKSLHSYNVTWQSEKPPLDVLKALIQAIEHIKRTDDSGFFYDFHKINKDSCFLRVFCFTRAEWLDVVEIRVKEDAIEAQSFSSGFLPLFIPFAFILNLVFFWMPFNDFKLNKARLDLIKHYTDIAISSPNTLAQPDQPSSPNTIAQSDQPSSPNTIAQADQHSSPNTMAQSDQPSFPSTMAQSDQPSSPNTMAQSDQHSSPNTMAHSDKPNNVQNSDKMSENVDQSDKRLASENGLSP